MRESARQVEQRMRSKSRLARELARDSQDDPTTASRPRSTNGPDIPRALGFGLARLGIAGAGAGIVLFAMLHWHGIPWIVGAKPAALALCVFYGCIAGLLLAPAVLRPDRH